MCGLCDHTPHARAADFIVAEPHIFIRPLAHNEEVGLSSEQVDALHRCIRDYQDRRTPLVKEAHRIRREIHDLMQDHDIPRQYNAVRERLRQLSEILYQINLVFLDCVTAGIKTFSEEQRKAIESIASEELHGLPEV